MERKLIIKLHQDNTPDPYELTYKFNLLYDPYKYQKLINPLKAKIEERVNEAPIDAKYDGLKMIFDQEASVPIINSVVVLIISDLSYDDISEYFAFLKTIIKGYVKRM